MKIRPADFRYVTPCISVARYIRFEEQIAFIFRVQLKWYAAYSSEIARCHASDDLQRVCAADFVSLCPEEGGRSFPKLLVRSYHTTHSHIQEGGNFQGGGGGEGFGPEIERLIV